MANDTCLPPPFSLNGSQIAMFGPRKPGLLQYVTNTTLPHIPEIAGMPPVPPRGHKSHKNNLSVKSEAWRRLENIYQIDPSGLAQQIVAWTLANIRNISFEFECLHAAEKLSLGTRNRDGRPRVLDHPIDTIDRLGAFLDILPLKSAQRLFHILYPDTLDWHFKLNQTYDNDQTTFDYFLWTRTPQDGSATQDELVVAYQPPWILSQADFEEFVTCSSLPPFITPGYIYPSELQSKHRIWAKLWDTCVKHDTKWFIITSWNIWAFGGFSDGWCSGFISDIWHLDEHTPTVLECITFWVASAMECGGSYQRPKVPEPVNALRAEIRLPAPQGEVPLAVVSESNWKGNNQDAPTSAHLTSLSASLSHQGLDDYAPPPVERAKPVRAASIHQWRSSVYGNQDEHIPKSSRALADEEGTTCFLGEWLI